MSAQENKKEMQEAKNKFKAHFDTTSLCQDATLSIDPHLAIVLGPRNKMATFLKAHQDPSNDCEALLEKYVNEDFADNPQGDETRKKVVMKTQNEHFMEDFELVERYFLRNAHGEVTEDEEVLFKIAIRGGIPEEFGWPENRKKLIRSLDVFLEPVFRGVLLPQDEEIKVYIAQIHALKDLICNEKIHGKSRALLKSCLPDIIHEINRRPK